MRAKEPFVVIGGGLAGLAAAWTLEKSGHHTVLLERASRVGGRAVTWYGDGWVADTGLQFIRRGDATMMGLVRQLGMDEHLVVIQGALGSFDALGRIAPPSPSDYASDRLAFVQGFQSFADALAHELTVFPRAFVSAVRWDHEDESFWFETERGQPLKNEITGQILATKGIVLATNSLQAAAISRRSLCLAPMLPSLDALRADPAVVGVFVVPRQRTRFYAMRGTSDAKLSWIAFEERKAPERAPAEKGVMIVAASPHMSERLLNRTETDMLGEIYAEARALLPGLPAEPSEKYQVVWPAAKMDGRPFAAPVNRRLTSPDDLPFALAGDFMFGATAEDAAKSGVKAAERVLQLFSNRFAGRAM